MAAPPVRDSVFHGFASSSFCHPHTDYLASVARQNNEEALPWCQGLLRGSLGWGRRPRARARRGRRHRGASLRQVCPPRSKNDDNGKLSLTRHGQRRQPALTGMGILVRVRSVIFVVPSLLAAWCAEAAGLGSLFPRTNPSGTNSFTTHHRVSVQASELPPPPLTDELVAVGQLGGPPHSTYPRDKQLARDTAAVILRSCLGNAFTERGQRLAFGAPLRCVLGLNFGATPLRPSASRAW